MKVPQPNEEGVREKKYSRARLFCFCFISLLRLRILDAYNTFCYFTDTKMSISYRK